MVSNEPGYYEDGGFGVRIENLMTITKATTEHQFGGEAFLTFDCLTMVPLQGKMIDQRVRCSAQEHLCRPGAPMTQLHESWLYAPRYSLT